MLTAERVLRQKLRQQALHAEGARQYAGLLFYRLSAFLLKLRSLAL